jgi:hypothetical protein
MNQSGKFVRLALQFRFPCELMSVLLIFFFRSVPALKNFDEAVHIVTGN